jgi:hypothetical protein
VDSLRESHGKLAKRVAEGAAGRKPMMEGEIRIWNEFMRKRWIDEPTETVNRRKPKAGFRIATTSRRCSIALKRRKDGLPEKRRTLQTSRIQQIALKIH